MKKIIAAVVAIFAMLAVASPAQASTVTWTQKDRAFVRIVRSEAPAFKYVGAKLLINTAHLTCDALDEGLDETTATQWAMDEGLTQHQAIVLVATSITVYCPRHGGDNMRSKPADSTDVQLATTLAKAAWVELDYTSQSDLCDGWYVMRTWTRNEMAKIIRENYNDGLGYISVYDSRRAAYRLMNWAC